MLEKFREAESYFRGERILWGPVIVLLYDALLLALQRIVIDVKGLEPIGELRKQRRLYLHTLVKILSDEGIIDPRDMKDLELLRDLRNRVVHEDYHPSREHAEWAYSVVKRIISKYFPDLFPPEN